MRIKNLPGVFNFLMFFITLLLNFSINWQPPLCEGLDDPADYLHQSKISLLDKNFYAPHQAVHFNPRPFTVPLFYKLCGSNPDVIIQAQKVFHSISTFLLLYALMLFIKRSVVKYLLIISVYLLMSWWNILGWTLLLLSESVSMSLLFCWIATFLIWFKVRSNRWLGVHLLILLLFSFTRDSWPYVIVAFNALTGIWFFFSKDNLFKKSLGILVFSLCIFFVQHQTAKTGNRYELPLLNTIVVRILPNTEHLKWFTERGMPCANELKTDFTGIDVDDTLGQQKIFRLYNDTAYSRLFDWVLKRGQKTYMQFLITHPSYSLLLEEPSEQKERIFAYDLFYTDEPRGYIQYIPSVFPIFNLTAVLILLFVLLLFYFWQKNPVYIITICLALMVLLNTLLCYNADALEVERHLFITGIMIQLLSFFSLALIGDAVRVKKKLSAF